MHNTRGVSVTKVGRCGMAAYWSLIGPISPTTTFAAPQLVPIIIISKCLRCMRYMIYINAEIPYQLDRHSLYKSCSMLEG